MVGPARRPDRPGPRQGLARRRARKALAGGLSGGIVASRWLSSAAEEARLRAGDMLGEARTSLGEEAPPPPRPRSTDDDHGHEH
ncbi:DUF1490 family protein [Streptomyces sp. NPDC048295]|uniref:DUF1490 family protein n=1 Tax=Streptomyces sp. NPDC048295 TaxID=3154617 RepID=UPI003449B477